MAKTFNLEQIKLINEHTKHITTLSAGSIVALVTLYEKLSATASWKFLVAIALGLFASSIISGLLAQIGTIDMVHKEDHDVDKPTGIALIVCWITFALAMLSLGAYGIRNI